MMIVIAQEVMFWKMSETVTYFVDLLPRMNMYVCRSFWRVVVLGLSEIHIHLVQSPKHSGMASICSIWYMQRMVIADIQLETDISS